MNRDTVPALSDDLFAALFHDSGRGIALLDQDGNLLAANRAMSELTGLSRQQLHALKPFFLGPGDHAVEEAKQRLALTTGGLRRYVTEFTLRKPWGESTCLRQTCSRIHVAPGACMLLEVEDHSEVRDLERALRDSEERLHHAFEEAPLGIAHIDTRGIILRANRRLCELHGYQREELVGRSAMELMADGGQSARPDLEGLLRGHWNHYTAERRFVRHDGSVYPARVTVSLARSTRGAPYFISLVEDLSKEKAALRRMRQQAQMLDFTRDAIVMHQRDGRIRFWNAGAERLFGWRSEQALGRTFGELLGAQAALTDEQLEQLLRDGTFALTVACTSRDGRLLEVERRFTVIEGDEGEPPHVLSVNTARAG